MEKLEKKFIKNIVKDILEIEAEALRYSYKDFDNSYAVECFKEEAFSDIEFYINKLINRDVNSNVVKQLQQLNIALFNRDMRY